MLNNSQFIYSSIIVQHLLCLEETITAPYLTIQPNNLSCVENNEPYSGNLSLNDTVAVDQRKHRVEYPRCDTLTFDMLH